MARRLPRALLFCALLQACATGGSPAEAARSWAEGPARWLLLPDEIGEIRHLRDDRAVLAAIDRFWQRRDPDPAVPGNPAQKTFTERVAAADSLYQDGDRRGCLTPRGQALVLLGPPPALRYNQREVKQLQPRRVGIRGPHRLVRILDLRPGRPLADAPKAARRRRARGLDLPAVRGSRRRSRPADRGAGVSGPRGEGLGSGRGLKDPARPAFVRSFGSARDGRRRFR